MAPGAHIILIGMPGAGKSTVGKSLASRLGCRYLDTDDLIESGEGRRLETIIREDGLSGFCRIESRYVEAAPLGSDPTVVATGGSVVYSQAAMAHLKSAGTVVFLDLGIAELRLRLGDLGARGVVVGSTQGLAGLWRERRPLYLKYADIVFACEYLSVQQTAEALAECLKKRGLDVPPVADA